MLKSPAKTTRYLLADVAETGTPVALSEVVQPAQAKLPWPPLKTYDRPAGHPAPPAGIESQPDPNNELKLRAEIDNLRRQYDELSQVVDRLRNEIQWQVEFWERGLKHGQWESPDAVKRRLSRLRGALAFMAEKL